MESGVRALTTPATRSVLFIILALSIKLSPYFVLVRAGSFTNVPHPVLYVVSGKDAEFPWNYTVKDRDSEFSTLSPKWSFYDDNGRESVIANEELISPGNWKWKIANSCPSRLVNRIHKESVATLVISKVSTADNGIYGCTLVFTFDPAIREKSKLIVTVPPRITVEGTTEVEEFKILNVSCSAEGPPTPNITWIRMKNNRNITKVQGTQNAILEIQNITRYQNETYVCYANNNPNEEPVKKEINVIVKYRPEIQRNLSSNDVGAYENEYNVILVCVVDSVPPPTFSWYGPKGDLKKQNESKYEIEVVQKNDFGNWTCSVTNGVGPVVSHRILLSKVDSPPDSPKDKEGLSTAEKVGIGLGVLALVVIAAVIGVLCYKYSKKKKGGGGSRPSWTNSQGLKIHVTEEKVLPLS